MAWRFFSWVGRKSVNSLAWVRQLREKRVAAQKAADEEIANRTFLSKLDRERRHKDFKEAQDRAKKAHALALAIQEKKALATASAEKPGAKEQPKLTQPVAVDREVFSLTEKKVLDAYGQLTLFGCVKALNPKAGIEAGNEIVLQNLARIGVHFYGHENAVLNFGSSTMAGAMLVKGKLKILSEKQGSKFTPSERRSVELAAREIDSIIEMLETPKPRSTKPPN